MKNLTEYELRRTETNVKGMCKTKQRTGAINIFGEKCGHNKELFLSFNLIWHSQKRSNAELSTLPKKVKTRKSFLKQALFVVFFEYRTPM